MFKLRCSHQKYAWGKSGDDSEVAKIVKDGQHDDEEVDASKPYAEFWMGVHPNGPSKLAESGQSLAEFIKSNPDALEPHEEGTLQFLFKVLSVKGALSVQTHPTKEQAKVLHAQDPKNYPDDNHKPEMAIALTDFQLMCGFRPKEEIHAALMATGIDFKGLIGQDLVREIPKLISPNEEESEAALKYIFSGIWKSPDIVSIVSAYAGRLFHKENKAPWEELVIRLNDEFAHDVGVLAPIFLNYFTLKPGQSTFLGPNRPHAYLCGDCIECMACSDNTIRAGLTPKFMDTETLCANLEYKMSPPPLFQSEESNNGIRLYAPPVPEFAVEEIKTGASTLPSHSASSLLIVLQGSASLSSASSSLSVSRGDVVFLSANLGSVSIAPSADFLAFRAFTPSSPK